MSAHDISLYNFKRICYVVMAFPHVSETFISEEAQSFTDFGIEVSLISIYRGNFDLIHPTAKALLDNNKVFYVKNYSKLKTLAALIKLALVKPVKTIKTLHKALKDKNRWRYFQALPYAVELVNNKVDYLHAHFADQNLCFTGVLNEWTGIPFGFTMHGYDLRDTPIPITEFSEFSNRSSAIVTVSEYNKCLIIEKYGLESELIHVAYNGIRTEMFQPSRKLTDQSILRLVSVGRLVPIKGHDILLEALHIVREQGFKVHLRLIGDGPSRNDLEKQVCRLNLTDCVEFMGAQSQNMICQCLNDADVFVMPSRNESFGVASIEAMATELPVIASAVGGLSEVVLNEQTGLLNPPENPELLAGAIIWMIQHPEKRLEMGKKGREIVLNKFTRKKVSQDLLNYWQQSILP